MALPNFDGLMWLLLMLGPLIFFQRTLHKELQMVLFLVTRRADVALVIFSLIFLPGVFLHELSHYLMAVFLRVKTGRFSLIPQNLGNGRLQLGYIETAKSDYLRDALIGFAPLLTGSLFVGYAGVEKLGMAALWKVMTNATASKMFIVIQDIIEKPDFWLWFYLIVVISSTMMPSPSDRKAWLPVSIFVGVLIIFVLLVGIAPWFLERIGDQINLVFRSSAIVFGISSSLHLVVLLPAWGIRRLLSRLIGIKVKQ
jgi:hypothetical protein